jgi:hypothetical protein
MSGLPRPSIGVDIAETALVEARPGSCIGHEARGFFPGSRIDGRPGKTGGLVQKNENGPSRPGNWFGARRMTGDCVAQSARG